jgi:hypothetical protein
MESLKGFNSAKTQPFSVFVLDDRGIVCFVDCFGGGIIHVLSIAERRMPLSVIFFVMGPGVSGARETILLSPRQLLSRNEA